MGRSDQKARILEDLVAMVHRLDGFECQTRVRMHSLYSQGRTREIDVLLQFSKGPYQLQLGVECKNYAKKIEVEQIDAFESKLREVGLPIPGSIFVSTTGFQSGAISKAKALGIVPIVFVGLDSSRLQQELISIIHHRIFLVPVVTNYSVSLDFPIPGIPPYVLMSPDNVMLGTVFDLVWRDWINTPSNKLGSLSFEYEFSAESDHMSGLGFGRRVGAHVDLNVEGHVLSLEGRLRRAVRVDPVTQSEVASHNEVELLNLEGQLSLARFGAESELSEFNQDAPSVERIPVPRLCLSRWQHGQLLWPPSDEILERVIRTNFDLFIPVMSDLLIREFYEPISTVYLRELKLKLGKEWGEEFWSSPVVQSLSNSPRG